MYYITKYPVGHIVKTPAGDRRRIVGLVITCKGTNFPSTAYYLEGMGDRQYVEHELHAEVYIRVDPNKAFAC